MDIKIEHLSVDDKDAIKNMYQYYVHDLSEFNENLQIDSMGLFDISFVDSYYSEDHLIPLKITLADSIIGFVFCSTGQKVDYVIQDLFILRNYRKRGIGKLAVKQLFDLYSGRFGLGILIKNEPAKLFWEHCFEDLGINYTSSEVVEDEELCVRLIFDSTKS